MLENFLFARAQTHRRELDPVIHLASPQTLSRPSSFRHLERLGIVHLHSVGVGQALMCMTRLGARGRISHELRDLLAIIEVIDVHKGPPI
jgi:hypothetical protein